MLPAAELGRINLPVLVRYMLSEYCTTGPGLTGSVMGGGYANVYATPSKATLPLISSKGAAFGTDVTDVRSFSYIITC